jgi:hypothetical protein
VSDRHDGEGEAFDQQISSDSGEAGDLGRTIRVWPLGIRKEEKSSQVVVGGRQPARPKTSVAESAKKGRVQDKQGAETVDYE